MDQTQGVCTQELRTPVRDRGLRRNSRLLRDPGSFRDPSGFVFHLGDEVFRTIDSHCASLIGELDRAGLLDELAQSNGLVATRVVQRGEPVFDELQRLIPQATHFLQHEKIPFISYPYEWSPAMLVDAAIGCLDLQLRLIEDGYSLKDASAYNVQFVNAKPVFIDVPSIERVRRRDVWTALEQFCRMFLYPLLLNCHGRGTIKEYFLSHIDGAQLDEVYDRFGFLGAMRRALLLDVWIPRQLARLLPSGGQKLRGQVQEDRRDPRPLIMNLRRLRRKIERLGVRSRGGGRWVNYAARNSYSDPAISRKEMFVKDFLASHRVRRVLDLGCNTGRFSELAVGHGSEVVAIDTDVTCIDTLYRRVREREWAVLPLVLDIVNPSPGMGFKNIERPSFLQRASFDCVFALALIHHLLVTARLPLESIRDLFADLTTSHLIVEFVEPQDPMFISLLGAREDIYGGLTLDVLLRVFEQRFEMISQAPINAHRTLLRFRKRS